ncbi:MAG TPA: response regulator transcription factor [Thermoanaerobaculia bacterium]|nr:response regulator transcription factor [Thermoanaerobaculia bacterium]
MAARVVIADDHSIVRKGLRQIMAETNEFVLAGEAATADELLSLLRKEPFDAVVLDLALGARNGLDVLKHIKSEFPRLPVLILSMHDARLYAVRSLRAGASAYIQKEEASEVLVRALRRVLAGGTYISDSVVDVMAAELWSGAPELLPHERLSDRELEVFRMLGMGQSVTQIAQTLNLSVKTVSTHRTRIREKTGLADNAEIVRYVTAHHL